VSSFAAKSSFSAFFFFFFTGLSVGRPSFGASVTVELVVEEATGDSEGGAADGSTLRLRSKRNRVDGSNISLRLLASS
jgi:hypothetical protein